jgi:hypothetical protein
LLIFEADLPDAEEYKIEVRASPPGRRRRTNAYSQ